MSQLNQFIGTSETFYYGLVLAHNSEYNDNLPSSEVNSIDVIINSGNRKKQVKALPLDSNFVKVPIVGELVLLIKGPDNTHTEFSKSSRYYYLSTVNTDNSLAFNDFSSKFGIDFKKQNSNSISGRTGTSSSGDIVTPDKLSEASNQVTINEPNPLQQYQGDFLIQGRFGQSMRLGSTPNQYKTQDQLANYKSASGNPIIAISCGHTAPTFNDLDRPIVEDLNEDKSSLWLSNGQEIPFKTSRQLPSELKPQSNISQGFFKADRINLDSRQDTIITSKNTLFLSASDVKLDSNTCTINTRRSKVDIDDLISIIKGLITQVSNLTSGVATFTTPQGPTSIASNSVQLQNLLTRINQIQ